MMRRRHIMALIAALVAWLMLSGVPANGEGAGASAGEETADWTVLVYLCGSDLESKHGFATETLEEIAQVEWTYSLPAIQKLWNEPTADDEPHGLGRVNVLVETGGSSKWHTSEMEYSDMVVDTGHLQRWLFSANYPDPVQEFTLMQELPLASMGDPRTLADFIRWGVASRPAERYALVLWDHGGGGKTGLFLDELFDNDIMYLDELKTALHDGGAQFDTVIFDACMMANLETACAVKDNARWMAASEEVVPGQGTAIGAWLQELLKDPQCDGKQLGRLVCDMTQRKFADLDDDQANSLLTWSLIDLSKIDRLAADFDRLFEIAGRAYEDYPSGLFMLMYSANASEEFGNGNNDMVDLGGILYHDASMGFLSPEFRKEALDALSEAVVYSVRGSGRSGALGLSFCLATNLDADALSVYARNCPSPNYLALLDAISEWTAPDRVYERARRLTDFDHKDTYLVRVEKRVHDGLPVIQFITQSANRGDVRYYLYRLNEETGQVVRLGGNICFFEYLEDDTQIWRPNELWRWPAVEGVLCDFEPVSENRLIYLFNIPVQIGTERWFLRCGRRFDINPFQQISAKGRIWDQAEYEIYGLWEGYDSDSAMPGRNVKSLSQAVGRDYRLLYPVVSDGDKGSDLCEYSDDMTMYHFLEMEEITLPAGTYYLEYEVKDMFLRPMKLDRVEIHWDGEAFTLPNAEDWQGTERLTVTRD